MTESQNASTSLQFRFSLLLVFITALTYAQTLTFPFLEMDDVPFIVQSSYAHSWSSLPAFFFPAKADDTTRNVVRVLVPSLYRPVTSCWVLFNYKLFHLHPSFWHFSLVLLYVLGVWLMWRVAWHLTGNDFMAMAASLLYALHPMHVESVAWISGAVDPLVSVLFLAGFLAYLRWRRDPRPGWLVACGGFTLLALLSKETAAALPVLIVAHSFIFRRTEPDIFTNRRVAQLISTLILPVGIYAALRFSAIHSVVAANPEHGWADVLRTAPALFVTYLSHALWPVRLGTWYETAIVTSAASYQFYVPLIICIIYAGFMIWALIRKPLAGFLLLWWAVSLVVPLIGVLSFHDFGLVHDRFAFLGLAGLCMFVAFLLRELPSRGEALFGFNRAGVIAVASIIAFFGVLSALQVNTWRSALAMYAHAVDVSPQSIRPRILLSEQFLHRRDIDQALALAQETVKMAPDRWDANFAYAMTLAAAGQQAEALKIMAHQSQATPRQTAIYFGWAKILFDEGNFAEAEKVLERGITVADDPEVLRSRLVALRAAEARFRQQHPQASQKTADN